MRRTTTIMLVILTASVLVTTLTGCGDDTAPQESPAATGTPNGLNSSPAPFQEDYVSCLVGAWDVDPAVDLPAMVFGRWSAARGGAWVKRAEGTQSIVFSGDGTYTAEIDTDVTRSWPEGDTQFQTEGTSSGLWEIRDGSLRLEPDSVDLTRTFLDDGRVVDTSDPEGEGYGSTRGAREIGYCGEAYMHLVLPMYDGEQATALRRR